MDRFIDRVVAFMWCKRLLMHYGIWRGCLTLVVLGNPFLTCSSRSDVEMEKVVCFVFADFLRVDSVGCDA